MLSLSSLTLFIGEGPHVGGGLLTLSLRPYSHGYTDYCGRRRAARGDWCPY